MLRKELYYNNQGVISFLLKCNNLLINCTICTNNIAKLFMLNTKPNKVRQPYLETLVHITYMVAVCIGLCV